MPVQEQELPLVKPLTNLTALHVGGGGGGGGVVKSKMNTRLTNAREPGESQE